jgi:hypothetical protein
VIGVRRIARVHAHRAAFRYGQGLTSKGSAPIPINSAFHLAQDSDERFRDRGIKHVPVGLGERPRDYQGAIQDGMPSEVAPGRAA